MTYCRAVIFDLDGLLIDSEPLWRKAEVDIFCRLGVPMDESMCLQTMGLRSDEVVLHWYRRYPWKDQTPTDVALELDRRVTEMIAAGGCPMPGAVAAVRSLHRIKDRANLRLGLASSSPMNLIRAALDRLGLADVFASVHSAENEELGKPHPAVYLTAARELGVAAGDCVAVEDSLRGVISALAAGMHCIAVPAPEHRQNPRFAVAHRILDSLETFTPDMIQMET